MRHWHRLITGLTLVLVFAGCASPAPQAATPASDVSASANADSQAAAQAPRTKRVTMIMARPLIGLSSMVSGYSGVTEVQELVNAGLVHTDSEDALHP